MYPLISPSVIWRLPKPSIRLTKSTSRLPKHGNGITKSLFCGHLGQVCCEGLLCWGTRCYAAVAIQFLARLNELVDLASLQLIHCNKRFLKLLLEVTYKIETHGDPIVVDDIF